MSRASQILEGLKRAVVEGRLPHALILSGPEGKSKIECVEQFAALQFQESSGSLFGGTSDLNSLLDRIRKGAHPDYTVLEPVNHTLGVDEVRDLPRLLSFSPLEASRRIVVIKDAGSMNSQASNAILKILEEPPGHTMFFLLVRDPSELLQTIVSRCQVLRFAPLADKEVGEAITAQDLSNPATVISFSEGSLGRANFLLQADDGVERCREACEMLLKLWEASPRIPSSTAQWVETIEGEQSTSIVVDCWQLLLRDFALTVGGARESEVRFREFYARLKKLSHGENRVLLSELGEKSAAINRFRVFQELHGNLRLDFASLLTELQIFSVGKQRIYE